MLRTLLYYYLILVTTIVDISGEQFQACDSSNDVDDLIAMKEDLLRFKQAEEDAPIPSDVTVPCTTGHLAQITWPSGAHILSGGTVKYEDILEKPKVIWPCYGNKFYGLVFANIDAVFEAARRNDINDREWKEYLWFTYNIPGNRIDQGVEVKTYRAPSIEKGATRIVVAVHEQDHRVDLGDVNNNQIRADKAFFEVFKTFNGSVTAGNIFTVERD